MRHGWHFLRALVILSLTVFGGVSASQPVAAAGLSHRVCQADARPGYTHCHAIVQSSPAAYTASPSGLGPATFRAAYHNTGDGSGHIAIVGAYDAPQIAADLSVYSRAYGLSTVPACSTPSQTACFEKFNQSGGKQYPPTNSSWAVETSLDVETAHGMCPHCRLTLVEANSPSIANLSAAVDTAVASGATVVSNSYGGAEFASETTYDRHYSRAGVIMVVSSGDDGYGTSYPAASPGVIAVGGTRLLMSASGKQLASEIAWSGAGSGCSLYEPKPAWQHDTKCARRSIADVAADADPATGAAIYDSLSSNGQSGWQIVGGTSLAAPLVAGILVAANSTVNRPGWLYAHTGTALRDITTGHTGNCSTYLCTAGSGYDGPTGLGVLNGL